MQNRLARLTTVLASAMLAMVTSSFAGPGDLGLPLGPWQAGSAPQDCQTAVFAAALDGDSMLSRFAVGAGPDATTRRTTCDSTQPSAMRAAVRRDTVGRDATKAPSLSEGELRVVRASVGAHGAIDMPQGVAPGIDVEVLRVVARELAFPKELERGTPLDLVLEGPKAQLLALRIGTGLGAKQAFYFRSQLTGTEGFFARDGGSMEHRFLRYPLAFDIISSPFSARRMHPVLFTVRPHNGVDFAAKPGTPVLAVGSGTVARAGWEGRFGRVITIEHEDGYSSLYAHLQRFAAGIHEGARVRKGQVIGYVGTSGLTTGPHLHFGLVKDGIYIDPLGRTLPKRPSLVPGALAAFRIDVARAELVLSAHRGNAAEVASAREAARARLTSVPADASAPEIASAATSSRRSL